VSNAVQGNSELSGLEHAMHDLQVDTDRPGWLPAGEQVGPSRRVAEDDESRAHEAHDKYWRQQDLATKRENALRAKAAAEAEKMQFHAPPKGFSRTRPAPVDKGIGISPNAFQSLADAPSNCDDD
jgi:hypothetical protein